MKPTFDFRVKYSQQMKMHTQFLRMADLIARNSSIVQNIQDVFTVTWKEGEVLTADRVRLAASKIQEAMIEAGAVDVEVFWMSCL